jgi:DNA-binding NarL/FixJ family response regulator
MFQTDPKLSIAILDDHAVIRDYLADVFRSEGAEVSLVAEEPEVFLHDLPARLDVAVVDLCLLSPDGQEMKDGLEVLKSLHHRAPSVSVLVLSSDASREQIERCYREGAAGYLCKATADRRKLVEAVEAVRRGERVYPAALLNQPRPPSRSATWRSALNQLTPREREVLAHVAAGHDNLKIAALLEITEHTVKAHMVSIYRKLKPENRVELALIARECGIALPQ